MKAYVTRCEWLIGFLGLGSAGLLGDTGTSLAFDLPLPSLCKWLGILLLAQSLMRDCCLLMLKEMGCECAVLREPSICLETLTGVVLLGQAALLWSLGVTLSVALSLPVLVLTASIWWMLGMLLHDRLIMLRRSARLGDPVA